MDPKNTESRSLEERFVEGRLSPEEHEELELRCLSDPDLLDRLEQAERELAGLKEQDPGLAGLLLITAVCCSGIRAAGHFAGVLRGALPA